MAVGWRAEGENQSRYFDTVSLTLPSGIAWKGGRVTIELWAIFYSDESSCAARTNGE
jgi:hypothetical protein